MSLRTTTPASGAGSDLARETWNRRVGAPRMISMTTQPPAGRSRRSGGIAEPMDLR
jgi:hypothetical protein